MDRRRPRLDGFGLARQVSASMSTPQFRTSLLALAVTLPDDAAYGRSLDYPGVRELIAELTTEGFCDLATRVESVYAGTVRAEWPAHPVRRIILRRSFVIQVRARKLPLAICTYRRPRPRRRPRRVRRVARTSGSRGDPPPGSEDSYPTELTCPGSPPSAGFSSWRSLPRRTI